MKFHYQIAEAIESVAKQHDDHSKHYGVFGYVRGLKHWVDTSRGQECFLPSGPHTNMDYGVGVLCLSYIKPEHRLSSCCMSLTSYDDAGLSGFGTPKEEDLLNVLNSWRRNGLPDKETINKELAKIGVHADWW